MTLKNKPGQRLVYLPYADIELLAECLVALANGDGGLVVLGWMIWDGRLKPSGKRKLKLLCGKRP